MVWVLLGTVKRFLEGMGFGIISGYGRGIEERIKLYLT
jgi:hypothetical protein